MIKRPLGIKVISLLGLIVGLLNVFIGTADLGNIGFLFIGLFCLVLTFGIFMLWDWARKASLVFSIFVLFIYILIIIATIKVRLPLMGIGLIFHLPVLLLVFILISYLNKREIKEKFEANKH